MIEEEHGAFIVHADKEKIKVFEMLKNLGRVVFQCHPFSKTKVNYTLYLIRNHFIRNLNVDNRNIRELKLITEKLEELFNFKYFYNCN